MTEQVVPSGTPAPPPHPPRRRLWRWLKALLLVVVLLVGLMAGLLALALFNEATGRWVLAQLPRWLPALTLEQVNGTLADGLEIGVLRWETDSLRIEATRVSSRWQLRCLRQNTLCLDLLSAQRLSIWTAPSPEPEPDEPFDGVQLPKIHIPWQFNIGHLQLDQADWQRGERPPIRFGSATLSGVMAGSDWAVHQFSWTFDDPLLGQGELELSGHLSTERRYPISAQLDGRYRPPGPELPFEYWQLGLTGDLAALAVHLLALQDQRPAAEATGLIDLTRAELPLRLQLETHQTVSWQDIQVSEADVQLSGSLERYQIVARTRLQLPEQPPLALALQGRGDLQHLQVAQLQAEVEESRLVLQGELDWSQGVSWQGLLQLHQLDPAPWLTDWPGRLSGQARTRFAWQEEDWSLQLDEVELQGELRQQPLQLTGGISRSPENRWLVEAVELLWGANRVRAQGQLNSTWDLAGELAIPDLATFGPGLAGGLDAQWRLTGTAEDPRLQLSAKSPLIAFEEHRIEQVAVEARVAPRTLAELEVHLKAAQGLVADQPVSQISLQTRGDAANHQLRLQLQVPEFRVQLGAQGAWDVESRNWQGVLEGLELAQGSAWTLTQSQAAGLIWRQAEQHLSLEPLCLADGGSSLCLALDFHGQDQQLELATQIDRLDLARLNPVLKLAGLELEVRGTADGDLRLEDALAMPKVQGDMQLQQVALQASEAEPWFRELELQARFRGTSAELELSLTAPEHLHWRPQSAAQIRWQGLEQFDLRRSCWQADGSQLCLQGGWSAAGGLDAGLELAGDLPSALGPILPEGLALGGAIQLTAQLAQPKGQAMRLELKSLLEGGEVRLSRDDGSTLNLPIEQLTLQAEAVDEKVRGELGLQSPSLGRGGASLELDLAGKKTLAARWEISGMQLALIQPFFPQLSELNGQLQVQGTMVGPLESPQVNGLFHLTEVQLAGAGLPVPIDDLDLRLAIENNRAGLEGTFSSRGGRGTLSGEGLLDKDWYGDIRLQGQDIPVVRRPDLDLVVQPDLNLKIRQGQIFLGGSLVATEGLFELQPLPPGAVETSPDVVFIDQREQLEEERERPWEIGVNLTLGIRDKVLLKGFGAQVRLDGGLNLIQGETGVLIGRGTVNVAEGRYEKFGQRLKVRSGQIIFNGPVERPFISLEAVRETESVIAGMRISGPIDQPDISLFSEPSLPEDTIMYYLLTGNAPGTGVGDEQALANRALLGLGLYGGTPLAEQMAETFGVEEFDVTTSGEGDSTAVNLSGYLSPRLFVEYGIGVFSPVNTLTLRYQLRPRLFLEAVNGIENILDVLYTFEF